MTHPHRVSKTGEERAAGVDGSGTAGDYKDYADGARHKSMELDLPEFLRRLCLHFLPPRFVKIRHFGFLANRRRQDRLRLARLLLAAEPASGSVAFPFRVRDPLAFVSVTLVPFGPSRVAV